MEEENVSPESPEIPIVVPSQDEDDSGKLAEANKKLYARTKQAEEDSKKLREEIAKLKSVTPPAAQPDDIEAVLQLRSEGYSDSEILRFRRYARKMNTPIGEIKDDPLIKAGIEAERSRVKVEQSTPPSTSRTATVGNKTWEEIVMTSSKAEQEKALKEIMAQKSGGKSSNE